MEQDPKKVCLTCGNDIYGRSDKKYCSSHCRNENHNNQNRDATNYMRKVNNVLRKNRRILASFNTTGKKKIKESRLMEEGFNFAYHTNVYTTQKGATYYFCYDHGYIKLDDGWLMLVIREEYVK